MFFLVEMLTLVVEESEGRKAEEFVLEMTSLAFEGHFLLRVDFMISCIKVVLPLRMLI